MLKITPEFVQQNYIFKVTIATKTNKRRNLVYSCDNKSNKEVFVHSET